MKLLALVPAALFAIAPASYAEPYVNIEHNSIYLHQCSKCGSSKMGSMVEFHIGYRGKFNDNISYFYQFGPSVVSESGLQDERETSAKAGISADINEKISAYWEIWTITDGLGYDGSQFTSKVGASLSF